MVVGLPFINKEDKICEGCIYGKLHKFSFSSSTWGAKALLELMHADICGQTCTLSLGEKRYFLLFVDDYSRMMQVYFLKEKLEAFTHVT